MGVLVQDAWQSPRVDSAVSGSVALLAVMRASALAELPLRHLAVLHPQSINADCMTGEEDSYSSQLTRRKLGR